jgi:phosphohistidine phosphatase
MGNLYLIRHGDAEPIGTKPDAARELTDYGRQAIQQQADFLKEKGSEITRVTHSTYVRAIQTADLLMHGRRCHRTVLRALEPHGSVAGVEEYIIGENDHTLLVSHLPLVADLLFALTKQHISFMPGTMVKVVRNDIFSFRGEIEWIQAP